MAMIHTLKRAISAIVAISGQLELIREPATTVDPWELLRESKGALASVHSILFRGLVDRIDEALKQHDAERDGE